MSNKKRTPKQKGKWSKTKGEKAERAVALLLSKGLGKQIQRKLGAARAGGSDIEIDPCDYWDKENVLRKHPGWSIEVKHRKNQTVSAWWTQTLEQAERESKRPLLVFRGDREPWNWLYLFDGDEVITDFDTWLALYKEYRI